LHLLVVKVVSGLLHRTDPPLSRQPYDGIDTLRVFKVCVVYLPELESWVSLLVMFDGPHHLRHLLLICGWLNKKCSLSSSFYF